MMRGFRCIAVWLAASAGCATAVALLGADLAALVSAQTWRAGFDAVLVPVCAALVVACVAWFWCVTTLTAVEVLRGASPGVLAARGGATRRIVLALCGLAVATQLAGPAHAADHSADEPDLAGLSVPDRASTAPAHREADGPGGGTGDRPRARPGFTGARHGLPGQHVVQRGDSLWSIAERALGPDADVAALVDHWHRTYAANRAVVGDDPDLIHPGQQLVLPTEPDHEEP